MIEIVFPSNSLAGPPEYCTGCSCDNEQGPDFPLTLSNSEKYDNNIMP